MKILTAKNISALLGVSVRTAETYIKDMKTYYQPKSNKITQSHFDDYFAIPTEKNRKGLQ